MNLSLGELVNRCPCVRISMSDLLSIKSTMDPKSQAFLLMRDGSQAMTPVNLPLLISATICLNTGRWPDSLAECASRYISAILSPSFSAAAAISLICESMDNACNSSCSVDFLAYKQYRTGTINGGTKPRVRLDPWVMVSIHTKR